MSAFWTLLLDSVRLLRARVLFWITLGLSALAALLYMSVKISPGEISFLFGLISFDSSVFPLLSILPPEQSYLGIFSDFMVGFWLSWAAVILALISCAPIFSDFLSEGSIGIPLSKPISRLSLFIYKYIGSLLFVVLQVSIFCLIAFVALKWRVGTWNLSIFWAVPLVTLMFSYIYSVVVLVSVKTKSVLAAILAAVGLWFLAAMIQKADDVLHLFSNEQSATIVMEGTATDQVNMGNPAIAKISRVTSLALTVLPKTGGTTQLLDRLIRVTGDESKGKSLIDASIGDDGGPGEALARVKTRNSPAYIVGSSLMFEFVILGLAAWTFCRRDY